MPLLAHVSHSMLHKINQQNTHTIARMHVLVVRTKKNEKERKQKKMKHAYGLYTCFGVYERSLGWKWVCRAALLVLVPVLVLVLWLVLVLALVLWCWRVMGAACRSNKKNEN